MQAGPGSCAVHNHKWDAATLLLLESLHFSRIYKRIDQHYAVCFVPTRGTAHGLPFFNKLTLALPRLGETTIMFKVNISATAMANTERRKAHSVMRRRLWGPHTVICISQGLALAPQGMEDAVHVSLASMASGYTVLTISAPGKRNNIIVLRSMPPRTPPQSMRRSCQHVTNVLHGTPDMRATCNYSGGGHPP